MSNRSKDGNVVNGFAESLAALRPQLHRIAMQLTRNNQQAEDLVQDTVEKALRFRDHFTPGTNLRAWAGKIMQNLFIDQCKKQAHQPIAMDDVDDRLADVPMPDEPKPWASLTSEHLNKALAELSPPLRDVFELYRRGFSYDAISEKLDLKRATVATRLRRARLRLRELLEGMVPEDQEK